MGVCWVFWFLVFHAARRRGLTTVELAVQPAASKSPGAESQSLADRRQTTHFPSPKYSLRNQLNSP